MISQYWVGDIPARPLAITVNDSNGNIMNVTPFTDFEVRILDPRNDEVDLEGSLLQTSQSAARFVFVWPTDRSLFTIPGDYLLQMVLSGPGNKNYTSTHTIRVREFGRVAR